jgi:hypothetical protein
MCFVSIDKNRRMKPVEIVLRRRREGKREKNGGGKSKMHCKDTCNDYNVSPCTTTFYLFIHSHVHTLFGAFLPCTTIIC